METKLQHKYSHEIHNKNILIIGPCPPPLGGVSIHIQRVSTKLRSQKNLVFHHNMAQHYKNKLSSGISLIKNLYRTKPDLVYYHEPTRSLKKLFVTLLFSPLIGYKVITVDHNCRKLYTFSKFKRFLFRKLIKRVEQVVVIGNTTDQCYQENAIPLNENYSIESPFLHPDLSQEEVLIKAFPSSVKTFIEQHTPLLTTAIFTTVRYKNKDLYGVDLCIDLVEELKKDYPSIGFLCGICKIETQEQKENFALLRKEIEKRGLVPHFYFFIDKIEIWPLIKRSDLFVRPSRSDSFGISIQEALSFNVPAVASDVCLRPANTILFKANDKEEFIEKSKKALISRGFHG